MWVALLQGICGELHFCYILCVCWPVCLWCLPIASQFKVFAMSDWLGKHLMLAKTYRLMCPSHLSFWLNFTLGDKNGLMTHLWNAGGHAIAYTVFCEPFMSCPRYACGIFMACSCAIADPIVDVCVTPQLLCAIPREHVAKHKSTSLCL